jgi:hypothetical protein
MKTQINQKPPLQQQPQPREIPGNIAQLVQQRAYERYLERGQVPGHELEDWLLAERDIRDREEHQTTE